MHINPIADYWNGVVHYYEILHEMSQQQNKRLVAQLQPIAVDNPWHN